MFSVKFYQCPEQTAALPWLIRHMFRQVSKQYSKVEANFLGRIVEPICKFHIIYLPIMVCITTHQQEVDLFTENTKQNFYLFVCVYVCVHVCVCVCVHARACSCMRVYVYVCIYI